jgi:maltooligosyltrehalose trehalohydrolase
MTGMSGLRVWAPRPEQVEVEIGGTRRSLQPEEGRPGWFRSEDEAPPPGTRYHFVLDGDPLPDPRSAFQPDGVHGPSEVVDHDAYSWHDERWSAGPLGAAVIYELHTGTFTPEGTFRSATEPLDHLVDLGVTHVELMPVAAFAGRHGWGYDGVDLYAPHPAYGGPEDLKTLVDACHDRGLAVLLDVVYNHLGPEGNYLDRYGPYFTDDYVTPWGRAVNLDGRWSHEVRRFFADNALMWLRDYHFDGLRLDAIHALFDRSAVHFLEQLATEVEDLAVAVGRNLVLIAESELNDPRLVRSPDAGGYGIDAQWSDDFHHAIHVTLTGERDSYYADFTGRCDLADVLSNGWVYRGGYSEHRRRPHGRPLAGVNGRQLLGYAQNHDQIGNRARGDRLSQLVDDARLRLAAALVLTAPFVPLLFQGEEWGAGTPFPYFADHEGDLAEAVRTGRLEEFAAFGWSTDAVADPGDEATFLSAKLDWDEPRSGAHARLLDWYRSLIALRRTWPELVDGRISAPDRSARLIGEVLRVCRGRITIVANLGDVLATSHEPGAREVLLASDDAVVLGGGNVTLPAWAVAILREA